MILTGISVSQYGHWKSERQNALQTLIDTGLVDRAPDVASDVRRARDFHWSSLFIARALLAEHFDRRWLEKLPPREKELEESKMGERLELARSLAGDVFRTRPASWQSAMVLGGARLHESAHSGLDGLLDARQTWEGALRGAMDLAPGEQEPSRLLGLGYLAIWPSLSDREKEDSREILSLAFEDEISFQVLAEAWLEVAGTRRAAFALVPDRPSAWAFLKRIYARRTDWQSFVQAHLRWDRALLADLTLSQEDAESVLHGGDIRGARSMMISLVRSVRLDRRYSEILSRALKILPPGTASSRFAAIFSNLLDWTLEQSVRGNPSVEAGAIRRLAGVSGELRPEQEALVKLATDDFIEAEVHERRSEAYLTEPWAHYFLLKARLLAERGDPEAARTALDQVHRSWRATPVALEIRRLAASGPVAEAAAEEELRNLSRSEWTATDWRWQGRTARLDLVSDRQAQGLSIRFDVVPSGMRPVELRWDQELVESVVAHVGETLIVSLNVTPGLHILELETLSGGPVLPGTVRITSR